MFSEFLQNSQESAIIGIPLLIKLQDRGLEMCFPVNFAIFLRKRILRSISKQLRLTVAIHRWFFINEIKKKKSFRDAPDYFD